MFFFLMPARWPPLNLPAMLRAESKSTNQNVSCLKTAKFKTCFVAGGKGRPSATSRLWLKFSGLKIPDRFYLHRKYTQ